MSQTATTTAATVEKFEREACSRCGGSGHYSYCQMYGTTCFLCNGKGVTLTKRGAAAQEYLTGLRSKKISDLAVSDTVKESNGKFYKVTEIRPGNTTTDSCRVVDGQKVAFTLYYATTYCGHYIDDASRMVRVGQSAERIAETMALAMAYQDTLTKAGTPRK